MQKIREKRKKPKRQDFVGTKETKFLTLFNVWHNIRVQWSATTAIFLADKVKQYEAARQAMGKIYIDKPSLFGPVRITPLDMVDEDDLEEKARVLKQQKDDKDMIKKGYNRVREKLKEIDKTFQKL